MKQFIAGVVVGAALMAALMLVTRGDAQPDNAARQTVEQPPPELAKTSSSTALDQPEARRDEHAESETTAPDPKPAEMDPDLALAIESKDETVRYRANQRFILRRALERFRNTPRDEETRYQGIILLSIATILDQSGNYFIPEDGVETKIDMRDGYFHFAAQMRHYKVRPGEFPEYDEWNRWCLAKSKAQEAFDKGGALSGSIPEYDAAFEPLILARAEEALKLVASQ